MSSSTAVEMNNNNDNITEHFNDEIRKLANSDKEVHKELVETITKFRDEEDDATEDDLWWDSSSPPPQFYTLVFYDDDVSLYILDASYADMVEEAEPEITTGKSKDMTLMTGKSRDVTLMMGKSRDKMMSENKLMQSVVQFLLASTPNSVYKPNLREEYVRKWIVPELFPVWTNAEEIFDDNKPVDDDIKYVPPVIEYPSFQLTSAM